MHYTANSRSQAINISGRWWCKRNHVMCPPCGIARGGSVSRSNVVDTSSPMSPQCISQTLVLTFGPPWDLFHVALCLYFCRGEGATKRHHWYPPSTRPEMARKRNYYELAANVLSDDEYIENEESQYVIELLRVYPNNLKLRYLWLLQDVASFRL